MAIRHRTAMIVVAIAALLFLALIFIGPALINVDRYRPQVISYLQEKTGMQFEIGRLRLTFSPMSIHIENLGVKNPPIFPPGYIVQVARIDAELSMGALLRRQVVIKSLVLEGLVMNLTSDPDGPWNFENPGAKKRPNSFLVEVIPLVKIKRGHVLVSNLLPSDAAGPVFFEAREVSSEIKNVNVDAIANPASTTLDGQGTLKAALLRFGSIEATNLSSNIGLQARQVLFTEVKAETYGGYTRGELSIKLSGKNASFKTDARMKRIERGASSERLSKCPRENDGEDGW